MSKPKSDMSLQIKIEKHYHEQLLAFCRRNGVTKADAVRYMIDTLQLDGVSDVEFDRWYETRPR